MASLRTYLWNLLVSLDQFINTALGGFPDETISSRAAKAARRGKRWGCILCRILHTLHRDHCEKSIEADEGRPV